MRHLTLAAAILLASCSQPEGQGSAVAEKPVATSRPSSLESILGACGSAQSAVADALQTSDRVIAVSTLATAKTACSAAARHLRETPMSTIDSEAAAAAIDQMASGLGLIEDGVRLMERSPARARRQAQSGLHTYQAGVEALQSVR